MTEFVNSLENPEATNAAVAAVISDPAGAKPEIALPPSGEVQLLRGLVSPMGSSKRARVRELTGEHEETIETALRSNNTNRLLLALLESGVADLGEMAATRANLELLYTGDADLLMMEIRRATYGDKIEYVGVTCPHCGVQLDVEFSLDEIPVKPFDGEASHTVTLRSGKKATVRGVTLADQLAIYSEDSQSFAKRKTILLSRCVTDIAGDPVQGDERVVAKLSTPDRAALLEAVTDHSFGPQFESVPFKHEECGKEIPFAISLRDMFPDLLV
jgi:hypothetical protein